MRAGRPPKYDTPQEMQEAIDAYFDDCFARNRVPLQEGLALWLGFASRQSLFDYERKEGFAYIVSAAKMRCGYELNQAALNNEVNATIAKLNLTSNYGFTDRQEVEQTVNLPQVINIVGYDPNDTST